MSPVLLVKILRGFRVALAARAHTARVCGRPCCALTLWGVRDDVTGFLEYLTKHKEPPGE